MQKDSFDSENSHWHKTNSRRKKLTFGLPNFTSWLKLGIHVDLNWPLSRHCGLHHFLKLKQITSTILKVN